MNDGIYYVYLKAILFLETNEIFYNVVDTLEKSTDDFFTEIDKELNLNQKSTKDYTVVNLFCILGKPNMVRAAKEKIVTMIQKNTKKFINGSKFKIDVEHGQMLERFTNIYNQYIFENKLCPNTCEFNQGAYFCECFYGTKNYIYQTPDYVLQVIDTWFQKELPLLAGKQMINQSFLFKDFVGRKALELISSVEDNCYYLVFEGNRKIKLAYDNIGTLNMNDLNEFVV
ncbi:MAG: hypothetical protein KH135_02515, partial [Firmicutes bacterium]|nr:hypothetical protein [Bacillota bacterium]